MKQVLAWIVTVGVGAGVAGCESSERSTDQTLTRLDPVPAGSQCMYGGTAIDAGPDHNHDGVLEDGEIESTEYVCSGPTTVLVRKDPVAPDATCPTGGLAVKTGIDKNGDGVLEDDEIQQTTNVCSAADVWEGDFAAGDWADPQKVAALEGVRVVLGSLAIDAAGAIALPRLVLITGNLDVQCGSFAVELPVLAAVDGNVSVATTGDIAAAFPLLQQVGGDLVLAGSGGANGLIDAPVLQQVTGSIRVAEGTGSAVSLSALRTIGGDLDAEAVAATEIRLSNLQQVGGNVTISGDALTTVSIPAAHTIGGSLVIGLGVGARGLVTFELGTTDVAGSIGFFHTSAVIMPQLVHVGGDMIIDETAVETIEFPVLREVDKLSVDGNPNLTAIGLPALKTAHELAFDEHMFLTKPVPLNINAPEITQIDRLVVYYPGAIEFGKLASVTGELWLDGQELMAPLADLSGLRALTSVHVLAINRISQLHDLQGLAAIRQIDALHVIDNPDLVSLDGIASVTDLSDLDMQFNSALASMDALRNVTHIGSVYIFGQPVLDIALPNVTTIDHDLTIDQVPLQDLSGLSALQSVGGTVELQDDSLSAAQVAAFLRQIGK